MSDAKVPLNAFFEAVFLTDSHFRIIDCNDQAVELLRATGKSAILGRIASEIPSDYAIDSEFPTYLRERLTAVRFVVTECHVKRDDGTLFMAETIIHRIDDQHILFKIRDITARTENFHKLEEANERLRASYRARMEFVSNVSHELRTPLTSMSYAVTNMLRGICGTLPTRAVDYLERIQVDIRRLMTTVNDILDLRQIENGTLSLHKTCVPLHRLLTGVAESLRIQAETKQQTLTVTPSLPEIYAKADPHKIERVFFNILSNAIKYTPEKGTITARIDIESENAIIVIDDSGIGIPPEALPRVSQRYFRVGDHATGTGLGLSIVREIVELHNGTLKIFSPVPNSETGTRVTITLPTCEGPHVVIISGDEDFIQRLSSDVTTLGNRVFINRQAIDLAQECITIQPAYFILDGSLPNGCLSELICQIRGNPQLARTPLLILTPSLNTTQKSTYTQMKISLRPYPLPIEELKHLLCPTL